jgi:hypothetical protein
MITDPRTIVKGRRRQIVVAILIGIMETLDQVCVGPRLAAADENNVAPAFLALAIVGPVAKAADLRRALSTSQSTPVEWRRPHAAGTFAANRNFSAISASDSSDIVGTLPHTEAAPSWCARFRAERAEAGLLWFCSHAPMPDREGFHTITLQS